MPQTTTTPDSLTPLDVAIELVATKRAIVDLAAVFTGNSPTSIDEAAVKWIEATPLGPIPAEEDVWIKIDDRTTKIQAEILTAVEAFIAACAERSRHFAASFYDAEGLAIGGKT